MRDLTPYFIWQKYNKELWREKFWKFAEAEKAQKKLEIRNALLNVDESFLLYYET